MESFNSSRFRALKGFFKENLSSIKLKSKQKNGKNFLGKSTFGFIFHLHWRFAHPLPTVESSKSFPTQEVRNCPTKKSISNKYFRVIKQTRNQKSKLKLGWENGAPYPKVNNLGSLYDEHNVAEGGKGYVFIFIYNVRAPLII